MGIEQRQVGDVTIIDYRATADLFDDSEQFEEVVSAIIDRGGLNVVVNLSSVPPNKLSDVLVATLIRAYKRLRQLGGELKLSAPVPEVNTWCERYGLDQVFETYEDDDRAVSSFADDG